MEVKFVHGLSAGDYLVAYPCSILECKVFVICQS